MNFAYVFVNKFKKKSSDKRLSSVEKRTDEVRTQLDFYQKKLEP